MSIENTIKTFEKLLISLNDTNLTIGGSLALMLHGLNLTRLPNDLDIIIHKPTEKQLDTLNNLSFFKINDNKDYPDDINSLKFKKDDYIINIILSQNNIENKCLYYKLNNVYYLVSSIKETIKYKSSYILNNNDNFTRKKDVIDFQDLKNSNFNYVK